MSGELAPHRCGGCDARWYGAAMCHCSNCHLTFGGVRPFEQHMPTGKCLNVVASRNFFESRPGVWSHQTLKVAQKAAPVPNKQH